MITPSESSDATFEQTKWEAEKLLREREISVKEREQAVIEAELEQKRKEHAASQWSNPLIVAILAASIAAIGTAGVAYLNGQYSREIESQRSEQERILTMIQTTPDKAAANLDFLLHAGLIVDPATRLGLENFLRNRKPGTGPAFSSTDAQRAAIDQLKQEIRRRLSILSGATSVPQQKSQEQENK